MQRSIAEIRQDLTTHSARGAWDNGVRSYAVEMFDGYIERLHITDSSVRIGKMVEKDLLNGARDWGQYSYGGCAEVCDCDICARLCSPSMAKRTKDGERPPNHEEGWLDYQARALSQAAKLVVRTVNKRI